ncbi:hypothetical protein PHMEG_0009785 [Phytophthora megakarya]|uniref:Uncharacterized protein n=1 Tax=Phytophthora megakarya TaxID=4795 RepID=A0A225WGQ2_9STRA|nr:hypothetical protein PHMEG_0009785 [Phytophthora megakarya]
MQPGNTVQKGATIVVDDDDSKLLHKHYTDFGLEFGSFYVTDITAMRTFHEKLKLFQTLRDCHDWFETQISLANLTEREIATFGNLIRITSLYTIFTFGAHQAMLYELMEFRKKTNGLATFLGIDMWFCQ